MEKVYNIIGNFYKNNNVLKIIKYYNIIILFLYFIGCVIYFFNMETYKLLYGFFVSILGFNLFSLISIGYIMSKFNFCKWTKMAFLSNVLIYIADFIFMILEIFSETYYDGIFMLILSSVLLIFTLSYTKWNI